MSLVVDYCKGLHSGRLQLCIRIASVGEKRSSLLKYWIDYWINTVKAKPAAKTNPRLSVGRLSLKTENTWLSSIKHIISLILSLALSLLFSLSHSLSFSFSLSFYLYPSLSLCIISSTLYLFLSLSIYLSVYLCLIFSVFLSLYPCRIPTLPILSIDLFVCLSLSHSLCLILSLLFSLSIYRILSHLISYSVCLSLRFFNQFIFLSLVSPFSLCVDVFLFFSLFFFWPVCLSVCLNLSLSMCVCVCVFLHFSVYLLIFLSLSLSQSLSVWLSMFFVSSTIILFLIFSYCRRNKRRPESNPWPQVDEASVPPVCTGHVKAVLLHRPD